MKPYLLILSILLPTSMFAQHQNDTLITKHYLDSLQQELHGKKSTINRMSFRFRLTADLLKTDTSFFKDSIVVVHVSKDGEVIKWETFRLNMKGCKTYQTDRYFDKQARLTYVEYWDLVCIDKEQNNPDTKIFSGIMQKYERLEYDDGNRLKLRVFHDNSIGTRRIGYRYDNSGKQMLNVEKIKEHEFWN